MSSSPSSLQSSISSDGEQSGLLSILSFSDTSSPQLVILTEKKHRVPVGQLNACSAAVSLKTQARLAEIQWNNPLELGNFSDLSSLPWINAAGSTEKAWTNRDSGQGTPWSFLTISWLTPVTQNALEARHCEMAPVLFQLIFHVEHTTEFCLAPSQFCLSQSLPNVPLIVRDT